MSFRTSVFDSDAGMPITNALVVAGFRNALPNGGVEYEDKTMQTDASGTALVSGRSNMGVVKCMVKNLEGYYDTLPIAVQGVKEAGLARWAVPSTWLVTNEVRLLTKRRIEPIPLCVKSVDYWHDEDIADVADGILRYDFVIGDWLPPIGNGRIADIEFVRSKHQDLGMGMSSDGIVARAGRDELLMRFLGEDNGMLLHTVDGSEALRVRSAPISGYEKELLLWKEKDRLLRNRSSDDESVCLIFRIRCNRNAKGEILSANYGKMHGMPVMNGGGRHPVRGVKFSYYLNPTSLDRNLEWDRKTNLFGGAQPPLIRGMLLP